MGVPGEKYTVYAVMLSLSWSLSLTATAEETGYLAAIRADVDEFHSGEFNPPAGSTWVGSADDQQSSGQEAMGTLETFSSFVKTKFPGTYIFYRKLPDPLKHKVYDEYLATGDLVRMKQSVFKYSR